ncbi:Transcription factor steA [Leucoagaricus sp. SymC.cos]|nr:Transcription factor steA [Leucoagaricus sp. SymC.cos]
MSPISPTYTSFSVPSPFSSVSSNSFPSENSPISESHFDHIPSPIDAGNGNVTVFPAGPVSVQVFAPQGDIAAPYASGFDYGMMALASDLKKPQSLPRSHDVSFQKAMETVYIPPPLPPQRHNQGASPATTQAHHNLHAQQSLVPPPATANDVMFDVDLDDWSASPDTVNTHGHSSTSYPSTLDQPTSRPKQGDLVFDGSLGGYPTAAANASHSHIENHLFEMTSPIAPSHNADQAAAVSQARTSSRQYHQHQSPVSNLYPPSQLSRLAYGHQQQYVTVHPAEVSPLDSCPSDSPLSAYPEMTSAGIGVATSEGCDPSGYMCTPEMGPSHELKGSIALDLGISLSIPPATMQTSWDGERRIVDGDLGDGEIDADGEEVDLSDVEQSFGSLPPARSPRSNTNRGDGEDGGPLNETDGSKFSEEDSSTDSDDSEFVPGSRQRRPHRPQAAVSSSYPSYNPKGRSLRTRSGTRYTPYPNDYPAEHVPDYMDHQFDDALQNARSKRFSAPSASSVADDDLGSLSADYLSFSTLSATSTGASRRRPRPSNTLPVPIPVPNLTKKSRGRRVPTVSSLEDLRSASSGAGRKRQTVGKGARMYLCEVEGCGKCFARGEHLKRHVRSIHTYEKPHRCPYPGCGKDFSRHDNLGQHMRVHKDYAPPTKA